MQGTRIRTDTRTAEQTGPNRDAADGISFVFGLSINCLIFASETEISVRLSHGVTVTQQILVLSFWVRIPMAQRPAR